MQSHYLSHHDSSSLLSQLVRLDSALEIRLGDQLIWTDDLVGPKVWAGAVGTSLSSEIDLLLH